jgi:hypothetical protein
VGDDSQGTQTWIDEVATRFDRAWRGGERPRIEDYLTGLAEPRRTKLLGELLRVELDYRRRAGESPTVAEYERRFPEHLEIVRRAFSEQATLMPSPSDVNGPFAAGVENQLERIGKYTDLKRLGVGGEGSTYQARDFAGHLVVLKRYHASPHDVDHKEEGRALGRIDSRFTARYRSLEPYGDELILVMDYIPGHNLSAAVEKRSLAPDAAAYLIEQVAEGLEVVHNCALLHRDIKPENIVVGDDKVPRLIDFGLAAHLGSAALQGLKGTPAYMAPEQAREEWNRIDFRTDVYGLGATLYALLTGQPPHPGRTRHEALLHASEGAVTPPRDLKLKPPVPRPLERIVMRALAADPAQRFATAGEFRQALRHYRLRHRRRAVIGFGALAGLFLVLLGFWIFTKTTPLSGELTVRVWSPDAGGKRGLKVDEPGALPLLPGEMVHLEAQLNRPAYPYLLWIGGQGRVTLLYPRGDHKFGAQRGESAREIVHSPEQLDQGLRMKGPGGLETVLLLVRRTPLDSATDLVRRIGHQPPSPLRDPLEVAVRGFDEGRPTEMLKVDLHRDIDAEDTAEIDDPLRQLMERMRKDEHFEVIKAVRFAYRGQPPQAAPK